MTRSAPERVALVTGAAAGIGRSVALRLAADGVAIIAVDIADQNELVTEIEGAGGRVHACHGDLTDLASLQAAVASGVEAFGRLDVVCAVAGIFEGFGATWELDEATFQRVVDIDLTGTWRTVKAAVPAMIEAGNGGSIVLVSSVAGLHGMGFTAAYTAAKHGVVGLVRTLVNEVSKHAIRVNSVHPTMVDTGMVQNDDVYAAFMPTIADPSRETFEAQSRRMHPMRVPWVEPIDVAEAIVWLSSAEARYVTGVQLPVDAGLLEKA